jgi:hypothetical protein
MKGRSNSLRPFLLMKSVSQLNFLYSTRIENSAPSSHLR